MRRSSSLLEAIWLRVAAPATGVVFGMAVAGAIVLTSPNATANSALDSDYGYERTWNAALRMLRVDLGLVGNVKTEGLDAPDVPHVYLPVYQGSGLRLAVFLRTVAGVGAWEESIPARSRRSMRICRCSGCGPWTRW